MDVKEILLSLGYSNISEDSMNYRMKPIYRDSSSNTVLSVRKDTGYFIDFSRNLKGNFQELIRLSLNLSTINEAKKWLGDKSFEVRKSARIDRPKIKQSRIFDKDCLIKLRKDHSYWIDRGVSEDTISLFDGGVVDAGKMKDRYVFPILNYQGELVGVSGRHIYDLPSGSNKPKWKHIGDKSEWKYPLQLNNKICRQEKKVVLVESIGDMLSLWDADVRNTMVTFGIEIGPAVVSYLLRIDADEIFVAFNNDEGKNSAGNDAASKAVSRLSRYFDQDQIRVAIPEQKMMDFGGMSVKEILGWKKKYYPHQE